MESGNKEICKKKQSFLITTGKLFWVLVLLDFWFSLFFFIIYSSALQGYLCDLTMPPLNISSTAGIMQKTALYPGVPCLPSVGSGRCRGILRRKEWAKRQEYQEKFRNTLQSASSLWAFNSAVGFISELLLLSPLPDFWMRHISESCT